MPLCCTTWGDHQGRPPRFEQFPDPSPGKDEAIIDVRAAALKPVDKQLANGSHYASPRELPVVCGADGVGYLVDGTRVFFGGPRRPYGSMAQRTVVPKAFCFPVAEGVDDNTAAALPNPGVSAWLSLTARAKLTKGETVLILGVTGVIGKLTVRVAKLLGAGRVIAAGRNEAVLSTLHDLGADATFKLNRSDQELTEAFARELGGGLHVIIDYLWGRLTEALLAAITRREFAAITSEMRPVQVGESAEQLFRFPPPCYGVPRSQFLGQRESHLAKFSKARFRVSWPSLRAVNFTLILNRFPSLISRTHASVKSEVDVDSVIPQAFGGEE